MIFTGNPTTVLCIQKSCIGVPSCTQNSNWKSTHQTRIWLKITLLITGKHKWLMSFYNVLVKSHTYKRSLYVWLDRRHPEIPRPSSCCRLLLQSVFVSTKQELNNCCNWVTKRVVTGHIRFLWCWCVNLSRTMCIST